MLSPTECKTLADALSATGSIELAVDALATPVPAHLYEVHPGGLRRRMQVSTALHKMVWLLGLDHTVSALRLVGADPLPVAAPALGAEALDDTVIAGRRFGAQRVPAAALRVGDFFVSVQTRMWAPWEPLNPVREVVAVEVVSDMIRVSYCIGAEDFYKFYAPDRNVVRLMPADA